VTGVGSSRDDPPPPVVPPNGERTPPEPSDPTEPTEPAAPAEPRPLIERVGMAAIAVVMAGLFGFVAAAAFSGGEWFLAAVAAVGSVMTLGVGALTLIRG
jgi:hypothetical protein